MIIRLLITIVYMMVVLSALAFDFAIEARVSDPALEGMEVKLRNDFHGYMDSGKIIDGKVVLKGNTSYNSYATIHSKAPDNRNLSVGVVVRPGLTVINLENDSVVSGSPLNDSLRAYRNQVTGIPYEEVMPLLKGIIKENADNGIGEVMLGLYMNYCSPDEWDEVHALISEEMRTNPSIFMANSVFGRMRDTWIGKNFIDIEGKDLDGRDVRLSDYVGKGRYVLIDFWASWCVPCIHEAKEQLIPLHEKYAGDPRFMILGLSIEKSVERIADAVSHNSLPWQQMVATGKSPMGVYAFSSIPQLMLIAPDGTIISRNVPTHRLLDTITRLLEE